ncbi:hypothetical protein DFH27DRAFT_473243, partial [Peziza echinospora]
KPVFTALDAIHILNNHWTSGYRELSNFQYAIQLPLLALATCFTTLRPGSLVESDCHRGSNKLLQYRDLSLYLVQNPQYQDGALEQLPNILLCRLTGRLQKRRRNTEYPLIQNFHTPILCPILPVLILAFVDDAFKSCSSPEKVFDLLVSPNASPKEKDALHLEWRSSMFNIPILRRA